MAVLIRDLAVFVLLFGQPLSTVVRLPRSAVTLLGEQVNLALGDQTLVLPPAVAELMITFLGDPRFRGNTAANKNSLWLFPGEQPGQPMHVHSAHQVLKDAGIPARPARAGTWAARNDGCARTAARAGIRCARLGRRVSGSELAVL